METARAERDDLFGAPDPPFQAEFQSFYWDAKREWEKLDAAYHLVLEDVLKRTGDVDG